MKKSKPEVRVRPLEQREYDFVKEGIKQKKLDGWSVTEMNNLDFCVDESHKYNGGFVAELLDGDEYRTAVYAFGEQDYLGKWYCKPGYMDKKIMEVIEYGRGAPVWYITAIVHGCDCREQDVENCIKALGVFFDAWHNVYTTFLPVGQEDTGIKIEHTMFKYLGSVGGAVLYARASNGEIVRSNLGITEWGNIDKLHARFCKVGIKEISGSYLEKVRCSGANVYSIIRGYMLNKRDPVGIDQMQEIVKNGGSRHSVSRLCYIFGASPAQIYEIAKERYPYIVTTKMSGVQLPAPDHYKENGLTDQYLLNISLVLHVGYKYLTKGIEDRGIKTSKELTKLISEFQADSYGARGHVRNESREDMLARVWRGMKAGEDNEIPEEIYKSLSDKGISRWVILVSWGVDFNYNSYVGRLLWLEKRAQRLGISIEEWAKSSRLDFDKVLRHLQYSFDNVVEAEGVISRCYEEIQCDRLDWTKDKKATVPALAKQAGGNLQQYLELYRSLSLGITSERVYMIPTDVKKRLYSVCRIVSNMPIKTYADVK